MVLLRYLFYRERELPPRSDDPELRLLPPSEPPLDGGGDDGAGLDVGGLYDGVLSRG